MAASGGYCYSEYGNSNIQSPNSEIYNSFDANQPLPLSSFDQLKQNQLDLLFGPSSVNNIHQQTMPFRLANSKYLEPAQQLLNDFCNLRTAGMNRSRKRNPENGTQSTLSPNNFDLQNRKTKLLQLLQEVDTRYKQYDAEMRAVVQSFEAAAGAGAAAVYSAAATKAMSRHFRCLRDGIVDQIKAVKKAMGEKESATTKGDTPRLRILDQKLRQGRALGMVESHPWRPQRGLPERAVALLRAWLFEHFLNPYPSDVDKHILARQTGLSRSQVSNWFINARVRLWKPMVEEMYLEDLKDEKRHTDESRNDEYAPMQFDFSSYGGGGGVSLTLGLQQHGESDGRVSVAFSDASQSNLFYPRDEMGDCQTGHYSVFDSENQFLRDFGG